MLWKAVDKLISIVSIFRKFGFDLDGEWDMSLSCFNWAFADGQLFLSDPWMFTEISMVRNCNRSFFQ
jgi:hypothetical protein